MVDPKVAGDAGGFITKVFISLKFSICYTDLKASPCILRALNRNSSQSLLFHTFRAKTRTLESHQHVYYFNRTVHPLQLNDSNCLLAAISQHQTFWDTCACPIPVFHKTI